MEVVIRGLAYRRRRRTVLDGADAVLGPGTVALAGPNGAGKTTLLRLLAGVLRPRSGTVEAGPYRLRGRAGRRGLRRELGYLPQDCPVPPDLTPRAYFAEMALLKGAADPRSRRDRVALALHRSGLSADADIRAGRLSAGARRRAAVAQAFIGEPRLVLLDEPAVGLDPRERALLRTLLAEYAGPDRTVVVATHLLDDVAALDPDVVVLHRGRIAFHDSASALADIAADRDSAPPGCDQSASPGPPTAEKGYAALLHALRADEAADTAAPLFRG